MKLLVIVRDDAFLPKGFISSVIQDNEDFSEYEKTCGFWQVIEGIEPKDIKGNTGNKHMPNPLPLPEPDPDHPGFWKKQFNTPKGGQDFTGDKFIPTYNFQSGKVVYKPRSAVLKPHGPEAKPFDHPGKARLDRSHSTIWDYGPGRTYSHPQSAFDALYSLVGSNDFTENHYIRGWGGIYYGQPGLFFAYEVLNIHDVRPTRDYRLFIDIEEGQAVTWNGLRTTYPTDYTCCFCIGTGGLPADQISYITVRDMIWTNATVLHYSGTRLGNTHEEHKIINIDASDGSCLVGIALNSVVNALVKDCFLYIPTLGGILGVGADPAEEDSGELWMIVNNIFRAASGSGGIGVGVDGRDANPLIFLYNNSFYNCGASLGSLFEASGTTKLRIGALRNNIMMSYRCIFIAEGDDDYVEFEIYNSDFNVFNPTGFASNIFEMLGTGRDIADFAEWQSYVDGDYNSFKADPLYAVPEYNDFRLQGASPALNSGRMIGDPDQYGINRTFRNVDIGAVQHELIGCGPTVYPRQNVPTVEER